MITTNDIGIGVTLANVEALAGEAGGSFPTCQKNKGAGDKAYIPFCVNGSCQKNTWGNKGKLVLC